MVGGGVVCRDCIRMLKVCGGSMGVSIERLVWCRREDAVCVVRVVIHTHGFVVRST